jgi:hypothetical protein
MTVVARTYDNSVCKTHLHFTCCGGAWDEKQRHDSSADISGIPRCKLNRFTAIDPCKAHEFHRTSSPE